MTSLEDTLESLVDKNGIGAVIEALAVIANAKGDHITENWQDSVLAPVWYSVSRKLYRVAGTLNV